MKLEQILQLRVTWVTKLQLSETQPCTLTSEQILHLKVKCSDFGPVRDKGSYVNVMVDYVGAGAGITLIYL